MTSDLLSSPARRWTWSMLCWVIHPYGLLPSNINRREQVLNIPHTSKFDFRFGFFTSPLADWLDTFLNPPKSINILLNSHPVVGQCNTSMTQFWIQQKAFSTHGYILYSKLRKTKGWILNELWFLELTKVCKLTFRESITEICPLILAEISNDVLAVFLNTQNQPSEPFRQGEGPAPHLHFTDHRQT